MTIYKLHSSGEVTPVRVHEKISQLINAGYLKKQAVSIAYSEAREDWKTKYPRTDSPPWLDYGDRKNNPKKKRQGSLLGERKKNPVKKKLNTIARTVRIHYTSGASKKFLLKKFFLTEQQLNDILSGKYTTRKKNPKKRTMSKIINIPTISPETTEITVSGKKFEIYDAFPSLVMATKYASDYKKSGLGNSVVRDLSKDAGRLRYAVFVTEDRHVNTVKKNPIKKKRSEVRPYEKTKTRFFMVDEQIGAKWKPLSIFQHKHLAFEYANAYAKKSTNKIRVIDTHFNAQAFWQAK